MGQITNKAVGPLPGRSTIWLQASFLIALTAWLWGPIILRWFVDLWEDPNYSFGLITFPFAVWLAWGRRQEWQRSSGSVSYTGLVLVAFALAVLFAGTLGSELFLSRISFVFFLFGLTWYLWGGRQVRVLALPLGLLVLAIPLPAVLFNQVAFPLQLLASHLATAGLDVLGVPVLNEGNIITLPRITLGVSEACSGLRSIFSLVALSIIYGHLVEPKNTIRTALVLTAIPIAIFVNSLRVMGTGLLAQYVTLQAATGFFHSFYGWLLFVAALLLLIAAHRTYSLAARIFQRQHA